MLARHVSDLTGPSSGAFCISCICRLWYVVIRVLLDTSSRYEVVGRTCWTAYILQDDTRSLQYQVTTKQLYFSLIESCTGTPRYYTTLILHYPYAPCLKTKLSSTRNVNIQWRSKLWTSQPRKWRVISYSMCHYSVSGCGVFT
jgi:hypothetical protein